MPEIRDYFLFRPMPFLADCGQVAMTPAEVGLYFRLTCYEWNAKGAGLPDDPFVCGRLCGVSRRRMQSMWPHVRPFFQQHPTIPGRMIHPDLELERQRQLLPSQSELRRLVFADLLARDGNRCAYCGATNVYLEVEHIVARSRGGTDEPDNLTLACKPCNRGKGTLSVQEFLAKRKQTA